MRDDVGFAEYDLDIVNLDELAAIFDSRILPGVIGVEGTPFAGKSTFATKLVAELGASFIPEHTDFDLQAGELALSPWPEDAAAATVRQAYFYQVERRRIETALEALSHGSSVVMDRTALSVVVYSLTRAATSGTVQKNELRDIDILLNDAGVRFPKVLYLLQTPTTIVLERARHLAAAGTPRAIEPFLLRPSTLQILNFFYVNITCRLRHCDVIIESGPASWLGFGG